MNLPRYPTLLLALALLLAACGGARSSNDTPLARLPSVTPLLPTQPPTATPPLPTLVPVASATAAPPTPTDPALVLSPDGPVTGNMARLKLTGEQYAALGDPAAPITLVEFSDYGCPYCRQYELLTFPQLKEQYIDTGKVYYVYKHFPVTSQQGGVAAQAAECAGEGGRFWEMHSALFANALEWDGDEAHARSQFARYAADLGLDEATFDRCMAEGRTAAVDRDFAEGMALRLNGTPVFFINGKRLVGAHPFETFAEILDGELQDRGR